MCAFILLYTYLLPKITVQKYFPCAYVNHLTKKITMTHSFHIHLGKLNLKDIFGGGVHPTRYQNI